MTVRPRICALMVVRNEADILPVNLRHHLSTGIEHVFAVDNGSADETPDVLEQFAREGLVTWRRDEGGYQQAALTTRLAHEARRHGADWVVPIDADEFWHAPGGSLSDVLASTPAGSLLVEVINFVQRRDQLTARPAVLLTATRRAAIPIGPLEAVRDRVERGDCGFVEMKYQPKHVSRTSAALEIAIGDHHVSGVAGPVAPTDRIVCFHLPLRSRQTLTEKVEHGERLAAQHFDPVQGWHVLRWRRLHAEGELDREWRANSYEGDSLDVFGRPHSLVFDPALRDLVRPSMAPEYRAESTDESRRELDDLKATIQRQLQAALHLESGVRTELAAAQARIAELQHELFEKVSEANRVIHDLQAEMHTKIQDANEIIATLHAQLAPDTTKMTSD